MSYLNQANSPSVAMFGEGSGLAILATRVRRLFETPFDRRARDIAARVEALREKSDAELAELGIRRDEILHFVFKARPRSL